MPWTVKDVDSHKKGLNPSQKSKWVKIANAALKRCQAKGGSDCDASAIRIANAAFELDVDEIWYEEPTTQFAPKAGEPLANFHSCRLKTPDYDSYAYKKCAGKSGGKCIDHVYGIPKKGAAEIQALRYPSSSWTAAEARSHCGDQGTFTAAKTKTSMEVETMNEKRKIPEAALHFMDHECFAKATIGDDGTKSRLSMVAYSGKPIRNHWYWGDLTIDLDGMRFDKKTFPILENHMTNRKVGFSNGKPIVENYQLKADPDKVEFVDTEAANEFIKLSGQGFPYESSIYGVPSTVERLEDGATAEVNGFTMKGPGAIWRQWTFKEMSVCVFGHDSNTHSSAFSKNEIELDLEEKRVSLVIDEDDKHPTGKEVVSSMTLEELKKDNPEVFNALMGEARAEVTSSVTEELQAKFKKEIEDLENKHSEEKDGLTGRILELEKKDAIRTEVELKSRGKAIWAHKLSESNIPEHLFEKVSAHVSHTKFVKDGVLDENAFVEAINTEIKDWEEKGVTSSVLGLGFTKKNATGDDDSETQQFDKENDVAVDTLCKFAGIQTSAS